MSRATNVIAKVNTILKAVNPQGRTVFKRLVTTTGGDTLIGRPGTVTKTDTQFDPQPYYARLGKQAAVISGVKVFMPDDLRFVFSVSAAKSVDFAVKNLLIVLKDAAAAEQVFRILDYDAPTLNGTEVAVIVFARSVDLP